MFLMQKLQKEASGILAWALKGCMAWQKDGLAEPEFVRNATQEYREDSDPIELYLNQNTEEGDKEDPEFWTRCNAIFEDFKEYSQATGLHDISKKKFGREMAQHGYCSIPKWIEGKNCKVYQGLRIAKTSQSGFSAIS